MSDNFIDFKEVKRRVSMEGVLTHYNIQLRRVNQHSLRGACPLPTHSSEQSNNSFGVDVKKNIWACQSNSCAAARNRKKGGNVIDFVSLMESCSIHDAALKLRDWFSISESPLAVGPTRPAREQQSGESKEKLSASGSDGAGDDAVNKPLTFTLKDIDPAHNYFKHRGIREETARYFGVGYFPGKGTMAGRVVIPIHNDRGDLIAYAGRSIDGAEPKYKFPVGFVKSAVLFNLHRVHSDTVIVVEGFFDCLKVWQSGSQNVVALMGCSLSEVQEKLLSRFRFIVLFLDGDEAGTEAAKGLAPRLIRTHFVRAVDIGEGKQPDQLSSEELRSLLQL